MIDPSIIVAVIVAVEGVFIAVITGLFARENAKRKQRDAHTDARAKTRAEESRLSMRLMSANTSLTIATALAVKENKVNGKMDVALREAESAQRAYYDFINGVAASQMTVE